MNGVDRRTGKALTGKAHVFQSAQDILTTPIGSRVMRRAYGSKLPRLVDAPFNISTRMSIIAASAEALERWEPRIDVKKVMVNRADDGSIFLDIDADYLISDEPITLKGVQIK